MRRLTAALGAIVLIATMTAAPVAAAKPQPTFEASVCTTDIGYSAYLVHASWSHVHGVKALAIAKSYSLDDTKTLVSTADVGHSASIDDYVATSDFNGYTYLWLGLLNHKGAPITWHYYQISDIGTCSGG